MKKKKILTIGGISLGVVAIVAPLIASVSGAIKTSYQIAPFSDKGDTIGLKNYVYGDNVSNSKGKTNVLNSKVTDATQKDWRVDLYDHLVKTKTITEEPSEIKPSKNGKGGDVTSIDPTSIGTEIGIWASKGQKESFELTQWIDNQAPYMPFAQAGIDNKVYNVVKKGVLPVHGLNSPENYRDWVSENPNETIKLTGAANPFKNTKVPLSVAFVDSPTSSYFQSILTALITWKTEYTKESDGGYKTSANMYLEGAKDITIKYAGKNGTKSQTSDKKVNITNGKIDIEDAKKAILGDENNGGADSVEFTINRELKWFDPTGKEKASLSARDFMAGLIAYYNSCELSFNANSYFFGLAGIDFKKTLTANNISEINENGHKNYNINSMPEEKFILKLGKTKNSSLLDILTKEYFFALPYNHHKTKEYIRPISEYNTNNNGKQNKIWVIPNGKGGFSIDPQKTEWDKVYGGGNVQNNSDILDVWSSAAYRVSRSTLPETTLTRNDGYFDVLNKTANAGKEELKIWDKTKTIKEIVLVTGGDNEPTSPEVTYDAFRSGTYDYAVVPSTRQLSAIGDYGGKGRDGKVLIEQPPSKAPQAQTINYNTNIWGPDGKRKNNITEVYENFVKKFNTDGKVIRQGINSMVNWVKLANLSFSNIGAYDYIQSIVPYGQLNNQYEEMRKTSSSNPNMKGDMPLTGATLQTFENMKTSNDYDINNKVTKAIKPRFEKALDNIGATRERPLVLDFRTLHSVYSNGQIAYLQKLTNIIDGISNGRIRFNLISRTNKSLTDWYYNKNSPMGSFFWSPDYNDVGTWVGLYFEMKPGKKEQPSAGPNRDNEIYNGYQGAYGVATLWSQLYYELVKAKKNSMPNTTPNPQP